MCALILLTPQTIKKNFILNCDYIGKWFSKLSLGCGRIRGLGQFKTCHALSLLVKSIAILMGLPEDVLEFGHEIASIQVRVGRLLVVLGPDSLVHLHHAFDVLRVDVVLKHAVHGDGSLTDVPSVIQERFGLLTGELRILIRVISKQIVVLQLLNGSVQTRFIESLRLHAHIK